ncbi:hypothetical protein Tco_0556410, partial [Tanacetum coccineum]
MASSYSELQQNKMHKARFFVVAPAEILQFFYWSSVQYLNGFGDQFREQYIVESVVEKLDAVIKMLKLRASQEGLEEKMTDDEIMDKVLGSSRAFKPGRGRNLPKSTSSSSVCNYPSPEPLVSKSALRRFVEAHNQQMKDWHAQLADKNIELRLPAPLDPNALLEDDAEPRDAADVLEDAANVLEDAAEPGEDRIWAVKIWDHLPRTFEDLVNAVTTKREHNAPVYLGSFLRTHQKDIELQYLWGASTVCYGIPTSISSE